MTTALRGATVSLRDNPFLVAPEQCLMYHEDALILIDDGRITAVGPYSELCHTIPDGVDVSHFEHSLITPGFVDAHVHYPQIQMIGAYGEQLLDWLRNYTYPAEQACARPEHASAVAKVFLAELMRNGVTTAAVYCTVHAHSVDEFFSEAERLGALMIAGKVLMDRNAPAALLEDAQRGYDESENLIHRWHGRGRLHYCVTPRFAPTSTEGQLDAAGALLRQYPGVYLQTHVSENRDEVAWVQELFPARSSYLDVYAHAGLVGPRSILGHGIYLDEPDLCVCHQTGAALAHCPSSNLFLGSGLFPLFKAVDPRRPVRVCLGSDVGAGTSLSPFQTLNEAYKVAALLGNRLHAIQGFYLATLGGAAALQLDQRIGRLAVGYDADICVLDLRATPLLQFRINHCESIVDQLSVLMTLGDDRAVRRTYVAGECVWRQ